MNAPSNLPEIWRVYAKKHRHNPPVRVAYLICAQELENALSNPGCPIVGCKIIGIHKHEIQGPVRNELPTHRCG